MYVREAVGAKAIAPVSAELKRREETLSQMGKDTRTKKIR
jgi:hypothetical protein